MPTLTYFAFWLAAALVGIGVLSYYLVRLWRLRALRCEQGLRMLDALARYCEWVAAQRHAAQFVGESAEAAFALDEACAIRTACFPELAGDMAQLLAVHNRLVDFLERQQQLRERDAEAWLESGHDRRFDALWHVQVLAIRVMQQKLRLHDGLELEREPAPSTYARPGLG